MRAGIASQHDHAIGQQHGLFNIVGHDEDARGRHLLVEPQLQQLGAQVLGGQHVERGEGLVHEKHFRLDHQRARKADALLHAAGEFLGIRGLESVESDGVDHAQRALVALDRSRCRARPAALRRSPAPSAREKARSSERRWRHSESGRPSACRARAPGRKTASTIRSACAAASTCPSPKGRAAR